MCECVCRAVCMCIRVWPNEILCELNFLLLLLLYFTVSLSVSILRSTLFLFLFCSFRICV